MLKKLLLSCASAILAATISFPAFAGVFYAGPSIVYDDTSADHSSARGVRAKLTLGYGEYIENYRFAGELFYVPGIATFSDNHDAGFPSTKITTEYGASFLPGILINDATIAYGRAGFIISKFTDVSTTRTGGQLGVGLQTKLNERWAVRLEYIYSAYPSISGLGSPHTNEGILGFVAKLC